MIAEATTDIAGIEIPSTNPIFLSVVAIHILLGLGCVVTGAVARLVSPLIAPSAVGDCGGQRTKRPRFS